MPYWELKHAEIYSACGFRGTVFVSMNLAVYAFKYDYNELFILGLFALLLVSIYHERMKSYYALFLFMKQGSI